MEECSKMLIADDPLLFEGELISVIVPVYNIEKYIRRCVESVVKQSYKNLEIILINDCSTDGSPELCDKLATKDNRIKVIHQPENQGLSVSRNTGVEHSTGEIIAFIDGDDYVVEDYIARLYGLMKEHNADITITAFINEYEETGKRKQIRKQPLYTIVLEKQEIMEAYLYQRHFITSAWAKIFKKSIIDGLPFPPGKINEDVGVFYRYIDRANRVVYRSSPDYIYIQRTSSIISTKHKEMERDYIKFTEEMQEFICEKYPHLKEACLSRAFNANIQILQCIPLSDIYRSEHKNIIQNIKKYRKSVIGNSKARLVSRGCAFISYFGIWMLKIMLNIADLALR
jgi:glycosyltransferase involved in cell wall biosynthesis